MRTTALALIVSFTLAVTSLPAEAAAAAKAGQDAATWRKVAEAIPLGSKVKVQTTNGPRVNGTLIRTDDDGVAIKKNTGIPEAPVSVPYESIANLERDHGGMHWGKAIGFGAAAGAAAILTIFVIALQLD